MSLTPRLTELVRAAFPGIWVETHEHGDAIAEITAMCHNEQWRLAVWDLEEGIAGVAIGDPLSAVRQASQFSRGEHTLVLVLRNFHRFLGSAEIMQATQNQLALGKQNGTVIVVLSPVIQLPIELEKQFVVVPHELPNRHELLNIAEGVGTRDGDLPPGAEREALLDAASGLTREEAENAFSLSLVRYDKLQSDVVWELKTANLQKSGLLTLHRDTAGFDSLGGLQNLKRMTKALIGNASGVLSKGVLLVSPPGCGKSQFCKTLGHETGRPLLILDVGALKGSLVGQSEERTRRALKLVDAMAPCVLMIDEVEKAFAGVGSANDSGVTDGMFGTFLTWLNDHTSDVFVVCTSNNISRLPPEFGRAGRFDGLFFVDLPDAHNRRAIWELYQQKLDLPDQPLPPDDGWTGAEIEQCCKLAVMFGEPLTEAATNIVPVSVTAADVVEQGRQWAEGRCLSADQPGRYQRLRPTATNGHGHRRQIDRN